MRISSSTARCCGCRRLPGAAGSTGQPSTALAPCLNAASTWARVAAPVASSASSAEGFGAPTASITYWNRASLSRGGGAPAVARNARRTPWRCTSYRSWAAASSASIACGTSSSTLRGGENRSSSRSIANSCSPSSTRPCGKPGVPSSENAPSAASSTSAAGGTAEPGSGCSARRKPTGRASRATTTVQRPAVTSSAAAAGRSATATSGGSNMGVRLLGCGPALSNAAGHLEGHRQASGST